MKPPNMIAFHWQCFRNGHIYAVHEDIGIKVCQICYQAKDVEELADILYA